MNEAALSFLRRILFEPNPNISHGEIIKTKGLFKHFEGQFENDILICRFNYLLELLQEDKNDFYIPDTVNMYEKAYMLSIFDDFSTLDNFDIKVEITGISDNFGITQKLVVKTYNTERKEKCIFKTNKFTLENIYVEPLNVLEQSVLCLHMLKEYKTTSCNDLRRMRVQACLDRLFFEENEYSLYIRRISEYFNSLINNEYIGLEKIIDLKIPITSEIFSFPIIPMKDLVFQLAETYYYFGLYQKSLKLFEQLNISSREIDCMIKLNMKPEAIQKITKEIRIIGVPSTFNETVKYFNLCINLAKISENPMYFDEAYKHYKSYEPMYEKGLFLFKNNDIKESLNSFRLALKHAPNNEKILFSYACVLQKAEEYEECCSVYKKLIDMDKRKPEYHKNLSMVYFELKKTQEFMDSLKEAAKSDKKAFESYYIFVIKQRAIEEIRWCLLYIDYTPLLIKSISYMLEENVFDRNTLYELVLKNPKTANYICEIFKDN